MAPASLRVSRSDGDDQTAFVLQDLPLMRQGLHLKHLDLIEAVQRWVRFRTPHASFPHQNVRISSFLSTQSPSIMPTESILLHRRESELLANFVEKIRIPFLNFSRSTAVNMISINHIFAGTVARTLSQVWCSSANLFWFTSLPLCLWHLFCLGWWPYYPFPSWISWLSGTVSWVSWAWLLHT